MAQSHTLDRVVLLLVGSIAVVLVTMLAALAVTVSNEGAIPLGVATVLAFLLLLLGRRASETTDRSPETS